MLRSSTAAITCVALLGLSGCDPASSSSDADSSAAEASPSLSPAEALARPRPPRLRPPPPLNTDPPPALLAASHILIQHKGVDGASSTRSVAEAQKIARRVLEKAVDGARLDELAREHSDAPDKRIGGSLGLFRDEDHPELARALRHTKMGQLVTEVVANDQGLHVLRRDKTIRIGHVLVAHTDARFAYRGITRDREEAHAEAERLRSLLQADDADWAAIAKQHSDCRRSKEVGGDLGTYGPGAKTIKGGRLLPRMIDALKKIDPGEVSNVIETDYGFHVLWRYPGDHRPATAEPDGGPASATDGGPT